MTSPHTTDPAPQSLAPEATESLAPESLAPESRATEPASAPIRRVIVANRGEIARRVMRTCRALGIGTVAVYSDPDAEAAHVAEADVAVGIGGSTSTDSYLNVDKILDAAQQTGADAVHPGYGFLSENPDFAAAVIDAGLIWIGPPPQAIRAMAGKIEAKQTAAAAGVPLAPGADLGADADLIETARVAAAIGYPVLVKASAGGGGKGMRIVHDESALADAITTARREAQASFGNPTVFLEKYLTGARHIEVQVFADSHGKVVHLFERECSIQRRHQKIIEETPSPGLEPAVAHAMYAAAVSLTGAIGYVGAGTVEFMVFGSGADQQFCFLEMNTRLQVEHPVTEAVTGLDLVEWQLRVAQGEPLPLSQDDITRTGHAIEVRLYAEDPANNYLPSTGTLTAFTTAVASQLREDLSVRPGDTVSPFYDPMIGKLIAHAPTRARATAQLVSDLAARHIAGITTNRDHLLAILGSELFASGQTATDALDHHPELAQQAAAPPPDHLLVAAAVSRAVATAADQPWVAFAPLGYGTAGHAPDRIDVAVDAGGDTFTHAVLVEWDPHAAPSAVAGPTGPHHETGERLATGRVRVVEATADAGFTAPPDAPAPPRPDADADGGTRASGDFGVGAGPGVEAEADDVPFTLRLRPTPHAGQHLGGSTAWEGSITLGATPIRRPLTVVTAGPTGSGPRDGTGAGWLCVSDGRTPLTVSFPPRFTDHSAAGAGTGPAAPVPGAVVAVHVRDGQAVTEGQALVVLEAMKMEHTITADADATIATVHVAVGDSVDAHQVLVTMTSGDDTE